MPRPRRLRSRPACLMAPRYCRGGRRSLWLLLRGRRRTSRDVHTPPTPFKTTLGAASSAAEKSGSGKPAGPIVPSTKRPIPRWMGPMRAAARWGAIGRRLERVGAIEVWDYGPAGPRSRSVSVAGHQAQSGRIGGNGGDYREAFTWVRLQRSFAGERAEGIVCVPGVHSAQLVWLRLFCGGPLPFFQSVRSDSDQVRDSWGGFSASLMPNCRLLSMDLRCGYHLFLLHADMRKRFTVRVVMADGTECYFQYLVLPFGWRRSCY
jgi:hypothetical protein